MADLIILQIKDFYKLRYFSQFFINFLDSYMPLGLFLYFFPFRSKLRHYDFVYSRYNFPGALGRSVVMPLSPFPLPATPQSFHNYFSADIANSNRITDWLKDFNAS